MRKIFIGVKSYWDLSLSRRNGALMRTATTGAGVRVHIRGTKDLSVSISPCHFKGKPLARLLKIS
jgi:hypothetical protein